MRDILPSPAEVEIAGTYFPPIVLAGLLGLVGMAVTTRLICRYRLNRYMFAPNLVMVSIWTIYTLIIGTFVIPA